MNLTLLDWQPRAACRHADPGLFFAPEVERISARQRREAKAKAICAGCPVRTPCLEWRLSFDEHQRDGGIWGMADEDERWKIRKSRVRAAAAMRRAS